MKKIHFVILIILIAIFLTSCDSISRAPVEITSVNITINIDSLDASTNEKGYLVDFVEHLDSYELTLSAQTNYLFSSNTSLTINGISIINTFDVDNETINFVFNNIDTINPNTSRNVQVTFDLNGGHFTKSFFENNEPDQILKITAFEDIIGQSFTFFDTSNSSLRWFYKLFINFNETIDAYEVVYKDPATAGIIDLDLPDYQYVLAVHAHTIDQEAKTKVIEYSESADTQLFVLFDQDLSLYESGDIEASFYTDDQISGEQITFMSEASPLPIPIRKDFEFLGWQGETSIETMFPGYTMGDNIIAVTYTALWEGVTLQELYSYIDSFIPEVILGNLNLPTKYSGYEIEWSSSDTEVIQTDGSYIRPYDEKTVVLTANIVYEDETFTKTYDVHIEGYKSLSAPIASSYIYRNYDLVDNNFFETLDIINTAFIIAQSDGSLIGTNYLTNVTEHIIPKARLHGNWVIMSVAPESSWSTIAANITLVNTFADNIVEMINTYGFDGVDIDWETPKSTERTRYTNLMRIVYEKVKQNNPNHLVTTAITGGMWQPPQYDLLNSAQYIDYINMMTYGMTSNSGMYQNALYPSPSYHNQEFLAGRTLTSGTIEDSVAIFNNDYNIPNSKIIVGVAFYGIKQVRSFNTSTQTWSSWSNAGSIHYTEMINNILNNSNYTKSYDTNAGVPYVIKTDGTIFISYDNPRSIIEKSEYIIAQELGGMMFWEYGTDPSGTLLNAMRSGLNK